MLHIIKSFDDAIVIDTKEKRTTQAIGEGTYALQPTLRPLLFKHHLKSYAVHSAIRVFKSKAAQNHRSTYNLSKYNLKTTHNMQCSQSEPVNTTYSVNLNFIRNQYWENGVLAVFCRQVT